MALITGAIPFPGYRLTARLGEGAFAEVWEGLRDNGDRVALKFLDTRLLGSAQVASEIRILRALAELRHPNIIQLHGVFASGKYLVLVMERASCNLEDLRQSYLAQAKGNIPAIHAVDLLEQAAFALDFLASVRLPCLTSTAGLQHCDIKPSNLLLVGQTLKVADFGLCAGSGCRTHRSGWKGTLPYAAPELYNGRGVPGTDQFALAVTFCEMVMGDRPFVKGSHPGAPPSGMPIDIALLRACEGPIIARALHALPSARWPNCTAFVQALRKAVVSPPPDLATTRMLPRVRVGALCQARV